MATLSPSARTVESILVIEGEPTERMLMRIHLERAGFQVIEADDGPGGLALARDRQPDLIILDIHLPSASGFDLCREIRADGALSQVPILISTGLEDTESISSGFNVGATDFLTKPTIWGLLSYRVKFLLRSAKIERKLAEANMRARATAIALAESERHYRDLFNNAPVMMHRIDERYKIQDVNQAWLRNIGFSKDEVIGTDFIEFVDKGMRSRFMAEIRRPFKKSGYISDLPCHIRRKDGTLIETLMTSTGEFGDDHQLLGAHAVLLDVTERNRAERKIREAQEKAEAANRAKSVFLATMSHEIRTPLNGVIGMIDLLEHTKLDTNQAMMIRTVRESAYSLLNIIGDILDFSKIEAGELTIEQIDSSVVNIVEGVIETLAPLAMDKNVKLGLFTSPEIPDLVICDPVRTRQILFNLVGNAIKFSKKKDGSASKVSVKADIAPPETGGAPVIRFSISDTGIGISEKNMARLFTPFFQAEDSTVRRFGGTGLGLSICKNLVELMGGTIRVASQLGEGTTFTVELPLVEAKAKSAEKGPRLQGTRILVVAPDPSSRLAIEIYLAHESASTVFTNSLSSARETMVAAREEGRPFDLAIFSHSQPQAIGAENAIIASLRKDPVAADMGIMILSEDRRNRTQAVLPNVTLVRKRPLSRSSLLHAVLDTIGRPDKELASICASKISDGLCNKSKPARGLILVAEDNAINQLVIQQQLQRLGYIADITSDGLEALAAYAKGNYKLLLTDCHMPEMDGFELTQEIRTRERDSGKRLPIVAITANALQGEADRCLAAGMDDYLSKPVELKKLGGVIKKWTSINGYEDAQSNPPARSGTDQKPSLANKPAQPNAKKDRCDDIKPIDLNVLSRLLGTEDDAYLKEMVAVYWDAMRNTPEELTKLVAEQNAPTLRNAAHAAKGASSSVGALPVSSLLEKLQFAAAESDWSQIENLLPEIQSAFSALERFVETLDAA